MTIYKIGRCNGKIPERKQKDLINKSSYILIGVSLILLLIYNLVEASQPLPEIKSEICDTNKCFARIERLIECQKQGAEDIVACSVNETMKDMENVVTRELSSLYELATKEGTWKDSTISLLTKHESYSATAYCDKLVPFTRDDGTIGLMRSCPTGKERHSIGYGTLSYKGAPNISQKEAEKRMLSELENNFFPHLNNLSCWTPNQKASIADFMYNSGANVLHDRTGKPFNSYVQSCNYSEVLGFMDYWLYAGGVKTRKQAERELFLK